MSSKRHHAEWLSLIEVSGPFLTVPVLERVFPQGLDKDDSPEAKEHARNLRLAYDEWDDNQTGPRPSPAVHKAWIDFNLKETFGLPEEVLAEGQTIPQTLKAVIAEHGEALRRDIVVRNLQGVAEAEKARLLVQIYLCSREEVGRMLADQSEQPADCEILPSFRLGDLDKPTLEQFRNRFASRSPAHPWLKLDACSNGSAAGAGTGPPTRKA